MVVISGNETGTECNIGPKNFHPIYQSFRERFLRKTDEHHWYSRNGICVINNSLPLVTRETDCRNKKKKKEKKE